MRERQQISNRDGMLSYRRSGAAEQGGRCNRWKEEETPTQSKGHYSGHHGPRLSVDSTWAHALLVERCSWCQIPKNQQLINVTLQHALVLLHGDSIIHKGASCPVKAAMPRVQSKAKPTLREHDMHSWPPAIPGKADKALCNRSEALMICHVTAPSRNKDYCTHVPYESCPKPFT